MNPLRQGFSRGMVRDQRGNCQILSRHLYFQVVTGGIEMSAGGIDKKYLDGLKSGELLLKLTWDEWLAVNAPFENVDFSVEEVTARYNRNGYDWDMHGTLYTPKKEVNSRLAFVRSEERRVGKECGS